jgi:cytoskeletal protein RodZ
MASLGAQLKLAREKRGVTLEDISSSTKIGTRMLRAIEADHYDQLPGGIFNKGFVRAFARAVGVDEEKAIEDYLAATEPAQPDAKADTELRQGIELRAQSEAGGAGDLPWGWLALALILLALAFAAWGLWTREERKAQSAQTSGAASSSNLPAAATAPAETNTNPPAAQLKQMSSTGAANNLNPTGSAPTSSIPASSAPTSANSTSPAKSENSSSNPAMIASTNSTTDSATSSSPDSAYFSVHVKVEKDSWLSLSSDGKNVLQGTIVAPAVKSVRAHNQIVVKAGNVGALEFEFNGQRLPPQGNLGEVKNLTFGADGLEAVQTIVPGAATANPAQP